MSKIEELIEKLCPDGVEYKKIGDVCVPLKKGTLKQNELVEKGYPVINSGREFYGEYTDFNNEGNSFTLAARGEYAGFVNYINTKFWAGGLCYPYRSIDENVLLTKFIYFFLKNKEPFIMNKLVVPGGIPALNKSDIDNFEVPVPPMEVQREIVEVLDNFAELSAELSAELQARRKQYEFYRNKLLAFEEPKVEWKKLEEVAKFRRGSFPQPYTNSNYYGGEGAMPFVQVADMQDNSMELRTRTKQTISKIAQSKSIFVKSGTILVSLQGTIGRVAISQYDCFVDRTIAIFDCYKININKKYFAYQLKQKFGVEKEKARGTTLKTITKEEFSNFAIPIPPLEIQEKIVDVLDNFDAICSDLGIGLPAEIEARQKQFEYYREKLLTFNPRPITILAEQSRAEQSRAEQSRAEQSRAEQSRAEQSRAEQSRRPN